MPFRLYHCHIYLLTRQGKLDILASDIDGYYYYYYENIGDKNTPDFDTLLLEPFNIVESTSEAIFLRTADMDNDADLDLVVGLQFDYNDYTESYEAMLTYLETHLPPTKK